MQRNREIGKRDADASGHAQADTRHGYDEETGAKRLNGARHKSDFDAVAARPGPVDGDSSTSQRSQEQWQQSAENAASRVPELDTPGFGLSTKLLFFTVAFVMLAEVLIFVPSVANFRITWLQDHLVAANLAALAAEAAQNGKVPDALRHQLLETAKVRSIALKKDDQRRMVLMSDLPSKIDLVVDLRRLADHAGVFSEFTEKLLQIGDVLRVFAPGNDRMLLVLGETDKNAGGYIEITLPEAPLRAAMIQYGINVLLLSVIISIISAALVYMTLNNLLIRPMTRITRNMLRFSHRPEDTSRIIQPSGRSDELGVAERELANMQSELSEMLHQKNRLAALGLAVSKINHDLRNMLASAQLISDRLGALPDPSVQRFAPKLIASLDRAITFCNDSLSFGRTQEATPHRELFALKPLLAEVGDSLGLPGNGRIGWRIDMDEGLQIDADRDQLYRVLTNLSRNAAQAIEGQSTEIPSAGRHSLEDTEAVNGRNPAALGEIKIKAWRVGRRVCIELSDDGPGIPPKARENLFKAFQGSTSKGGTGLGLVIARELVTAHGGTIELLDTDVGTAFRFSILDRRA